MKEESVRKFKRTCRQVRKQYWYAVALPAIFRRLGAYGRLMRVDKPIGTFLLLWPTLWSLWLAGKGHPDPRIFVLFVVGVFVMRAAGCVINDYADRHFDGHVQRTRNRPLAKREVTDQEALGLFVLLSLIALLIVLTMNRLTLLLSIPGIILAISYPFMKRYTYLPQPYLGMAFGWGIPMAWAAQTGTLATTAWLIFIANIIWATVYDTMYAMVDRPDDLKLGIKSTAILFGELDRLIIFLLQLVLMLNLFLVGWQGHLGAAYNWGLAVAACFAAYQLYLIRQRKREHCFRAFLNNNWFGAAVFAGIVLHYTFTS